jgi:small subunit ribosomal protein S1
MDLNTVGLSDAEQQGATASAEPAEPSIITSAAETAVETITEAPIQPELSAYSEAVSNGVVVDAPAVESTADEAPVNEEIVTAESAADAAPVSAEVATAEDTAAPVAETDAAAASDVPVAEVPAEAATAEVPAAPTPQSHLKRGQLIEVPILATSPVQILLDVGEGQQGIITSAEIEKMSRQQIEALVVGEKVTVYVVNPYEKRDGKAIVSIVRAIEELDWQRAEEYAKSQEAYESRVAGYNKGGLIVRFGRLRGFVPQSQLSNERRRGEGDNQEERWSKMVNEPITVKVMEVDRQRNRLILSERMASRESREKRKEALVSQLTVGEVRTGRVVSLEDFGAFIDIGGAEGLVHLTEISWQHVTHPRDVLKEGQEVTVEVISVDKEHKRIGLSMKRQNPDPWDTIAVTYEVGQLVQGVVTKLTKFGAFVQLVDVPEIEGLIHISELSERRVNTPREVVQENDKLTLRVVKIDVKDRRLGLSLKRVNSAEYLDRDWGG